MGSASEGVQALIDEARAQQSKPRFAGSFKVGVSGNSLTATIEAGFARNLEIEQGDEIRQYVSEDGRAMVTFFPEGDDEC